MPLSASDTPGLPHPEYIPQPVQSGYDGETQIGPSLGRAKSRSAKKRLSLVLSSRTYDELQELANDSDTSMKEIIRLAISLVKLVIREHAAGNRLIVVDRDGRALHAVVIPD